MRTFRSLRHVNYRLYFFGQMTSLIGSWMQTTTLMWLAHQETHQAKWPAFLVAAQIGPTLFLGAWGGSLADRFPKRPLIFLTQSGFILTAVLLLTLFFTGQLTVWVMLCVMLLQGFFQAIDLPARLSFVPNLVKHEDLINAVALNSLQFNVARAIGPAIAGLCLEHLGPGWCFVANAVSYLALLLALFVMKLPPDEPGKKARNRDGGFAVLRRYPDLLAIILSAGFIAIIGWPLLALLPAYADHVLQRNDGGYSMLLSGVGIGALVAALSAATFGTVQRQRRMMIGGILVVSLALFGLSFSAQMPVSIVCAGMFGFGMILFFATGQSVVQISIDNENRGKVMGVWAMMLSAGVPIGNLLLGPPADWIGVTKVIAIQGCLAAILVAILIARRLR